MKAVKVTLIVVGVLAIVSVVLFCAMTFGYILAGGGPK